MGKGDSQRRVDRQPISRLQLAVEFEVIPQISIGAPSDAGTAPITVSPEPLPCLRVAVPAIVGLLLALLVLVEKITAHCANSGANEGTFAGVGTE